MRYLAALIVGLILPISFAGTAEATPYPVRPRVDFPYKDVCRNIPGRQTIYQTYGTGPYRFVNKDKGICRKR